MDIGNLPHNVGSGAESMKKCRGAAVFFAGIVDKIKTCNKVYLSLAFVIPAVIMFLIYGAMGVYPVRNNSVLVLDLNGQYVYFFEGLRDILLEGKSLLYSFSRNLGGEFLGIVAYYLASPLSLLVLLFPKEMITEALLTIFLIKCGLCGFTCGIYLHHVFEGEKHKTAVLAFSTMYALCAYAVVMHHNTMWMDNMYLMPLIALGIERMITHKRFILFVWTTALAIFSNYYIGYMMCFFIAIYFFMAYFSKTPDKRNPLFEDAHFAKSLLRIVCFSLIAIAIASIIIVPAYYSLTFGKTEFTKPSFSFTQKYDFLDMFTKLYIGSYDTVRPEGMPFLYTGMLTLFCVPLFFLSKKFLLREKIGYACFILFFLFCMNGSTTDIVMHGFQKPNWLNHRYGFMLCFMLVVVAFRAFTVIREFDFRIIGGIGAAIAGILLVMQKFDYENLPDLTAVWVSLGFIFAYLIILRAVAKSSLPDTAQTVLLIFVCIEMFCAGLLNLLALDDDVIYSSRKGYRTFMDRFTPVVEMIQESDTDFYRMEKTIHRKTNDNFALGIQGLSCSTSTLNADTIAFLKELGLLSKSHWSRYNGGTPVSDSLLGLRYIITDKDAVMDEHLTKLYDYNEDLSVYKNEYALPIAFSVSGEVLNTDLDAYSSPFERMNVMISDMLAEKEGNVTDIAIFKPLEIDNTATESCTFSYVTGHKKYTPTSPAKTAKILYTLTAKEDGMVYCYFPSEYPREVSLTLNGEDYGTFFANESFCILSLGYYNAGDNITLTLSMEEDSLYIARDNTFFYTVDMDAFTDAFARLAEGGIELTDYAEDSFYGTITVPENASMILTTIPYDEGWKITLDGEKVEPVETYEALLAIEAEPGEHTLTMIYRPSIYYAGVGLCMLGLISYIICICIYCRRKKNFPAQYDTISEVVIPDAEAFAFIEENAAFFNNENTKDESSNDNEGTLS